MPRSNLRFGSSVVVAAVTAALTAGCGSSSSPQPTAEPLGKTAAQRPKMLYAGANPCTTGTEVVLGPQTGSPANQVVCGATVTPPSSPALHVYLGIPYADPPVGANRWAPTTPPTWTEIPATEYGPKCPQGKAADLGILGTDEGEDCLYLNVWTPKVTPSGGGDLPVMVFIHGGAFISGSGGAAAGTMPGHLNLYEGGQFVATSQSLKTPVVFVTLNYRLGVLGFLASDTLGLDGNYGLLDQTAALEWVQRNIAKFGGNPNNVTIFGESAGAQSVALHLTIQANGHQALFNRAAMESNYAISYQTPKEARGKAADFAWRASCDSAGSPTAVLSCLKKLPLENVIASQLFAYSASDTLCNGLQTFIPWQPVIDGTFVQHDPIQGPIQKSVLLGSNLTESIPFVVSWFPTDGTDGALLYPALLGFLFGEVNAIEIHTLYEVAHSRMSPLQKMEQVVTDYLWTCFNRAMAGVVAASGKPVYRYHYVHHGSFSVWTNPLKETQSKTALACAASGAVCHADELPFVFGNPSDMALVRQTFSTEEQGFTTALQSYWINFSVGGNPNGASLPTWPKDDLAVPLLTRQFQELQAPVSAIQSRLDATLDAQAFCSLLWDGIGYEVKSAYYGKPVCAPK